MNKRIQIEGNKKNLSRAFILPMVSVNYKMLPSNFINSYITEDYKVVLIYDKTEDYDEIFSHYLSRTIENNINFIEYQDLDEEVVLFFKVPNIFKEDFDKFLKGEYSEFSENYKKVICNYFGRKTMKEGFTVTEYNVIYPEDFKRKQIAENLSTENSIVDYKLIKEVIDCPDLKREIYQPINILTIQNLTF